MVKSWMRVCNEEITELVPLERELGEEVIDETWARVVDGFEC